MITDRAAVAQIGVQVAGPLALVVTAFLFFAGHNQPGGGFAAGLVLGAVVAVRTVVGLARPRDAVTLLGAGGLVAGATALAPLLWGEVFLDQVVVDGELPALGTVKTGTALVFDAGVALIVVGLVVAVLNGLGADELGSADPRESSP
ncbi:MAG: MnhB domain-containing protein [Actinomycetota bacterium]